MYFAQTVISIQQMTSIWRRSFFEQNFPIILDVDFCDKTIFNSYNHLSETKYDVVLSYHENDKACAEYLGERLKEHIPNIKISLPVNDKSLHLHIIDEAKLVVPLLSESYVKSAELMEEYHTALCRHRFADELILFPIIVGDLPLSPVYPQITLCLFSTLDNIWLTELSGDPVSSCLSFAATVLSNLLARCPKVETSYKTLLSMKELEDWSYCKARNGQDAVSEIRPILFTGGGSSHMVSLSSKSTKSVSPHGPAASVNKVNAHGPTEREKRNWRNKKQEHIEEGNNTEDLSHSEGKNQSIPEDATQRRAVETGPSNSANAEQPLHSDGQNQSDPLNMDSNNSSNTRDICHTGDADRKVATNAELLNPFVGARILTNRTTTNRFVRKKRKETCGK